jgi:hypothetical protein
MAKKLFIKWTQKNKEMLMKNTSNIIKERDLDAKFN